MSTIDEIIKSNIERLPFVEYAFEIHQKVKVRKSTFDDGVTPDCWRGVQCVVINRRATMISLYQVYLLSNPNGGQDWFKEEEIYSRKKKHNADFNKEK